MTVAPAACAAIAAAFSVEPSLTKMAALSGAMFERCERPSFEWSATTMSPSEAAMQTLTDRYQRVLTALRPRLLNAPTGDESED